MSAVPPREEIKFGEIEMFLPKSADAITIARKLLNLFEEGIDAIELPVKAAIGRTKIETSPEVVKTKNIACPHCSSTEVSKYGTRSNKSGKIQQYWCNQCQKVFVDEKITDSAPKIKKPSEKLFSEAKGKPVLNGFMEAPRFDYSQVQKQTLGKSIFWEFNGCLAIKKEGAADIVFATTEQIEIMKKLDKEGLKEYIKNINVPKQYVLKEFLENLKDDAAGILPKVKPDTKGSHGEDFEKIEEA